MNRQALWAIGLLLGAGVLAFVMVSLRPEPEEQERVVQAPLVETAAFEAASGPLQVLGSGTVLPREEVTIGAEVGGKLTYVNPGFREGSIVGGGTQLMRIDTADYRNRVRMAQADVAAQDVAVLQAREEVAIAEAELESFSRRENSSSDFVQSVDSDDYASRILPPAGTGNGAGNIGGSTTEPTRLATRQPQLQSARAARERAAASLADARLSLSRTSVSAPFRGIVRSESAAVGTLVQPGQTLGSIVSVSSFEVRVSLTQQEAALIPDVLRNTGARIPASVYSDFGGLTYRWSAFVDRTDGILDPETRTIDVFLRVPNPLGGGALYTEGEDAAEASRAPPLLLGSFVRAEITGASLTQYAAIPAENLRTGNTIWVVRDGKLRILPVRVLQRTDDVAYITTPTLAQGGRLVTSNLRAPTDGMDVRMNRVAPAKGAGADDE